MYVTATMRTVSRHVGMKASVRPCEDERATTDELTETVCANLGVA